jgi:hypothetical protein
MRTALRTCVGTMIAGAALLAGCRSGAVPSQVLTKPAPASAPATTPRVGGPWAYRPSTEREAFAVDQQAIVVIRLDTSAHTDTVSSHAEVAFRVAATTHGIDGDVGAFLVQDVTHAAGTPPGLVTPFPFRAEYPARGIQLDFIAPVNAAPCSSTALAVAQSLRDLWFQPPDTLRVGATWSDSSSYVVCRDGIPLHATVHRVFHISAMAAAGGQPLLSISRVARTVIDGSGTQFGETVGVNGAGTGQLAYNFDPASGEIVSATGNATLDLSLHSHLSTQNVHQAVEIRISRR